MAKKDTDIKENTDRKKEQEQVEKSSEPKQQEKDLEKSKKTYVKNANASGQGTMGRNDE